MNQYLRLSFWGMGISALGTLPLGVLNVAAMQISMAEGIYQATLFSLGVALIEVGYVRVSVVGIDWIRKHNRLLRWMDWLAFGIVAALAISSFIAAGKPGEEGHNLLLNNEINSFLLGMGMSAINPMQIPFWFGWSTVLFSNGVLRPGRRNYDWYSLGIGVGTLIGLAIFVLGGQVLVTHLHGHQQTLNYAIAGIFAVTALIFFYRIVSGSGAASQLKAKQTGE